MTTLQDLAKEIKAAEEVIQSVSRILSDAARSAVIEIINATTQTLTIRRTTHEHGAFAKDSLPDNTIPPMQSNVFGSRSSEGGIMVGTEGRVWYTIGADTAVLYIRWNVPFLGGNDKSFGIEGASSSFYTIAAEQSGGNKKAKFRFILGEKALLGPSDPDWITCGECKGLFYKLETGRCPGRPEWGNRRPIEIAPGKTIGEPKFLGHQPMGHGLKVFHDIPGPNREGSWRRCKRCKQMFFDGFENKGACPKWSKPRPGHEAEGPEYFLQFDIAPGASQQNDWRFCSKCYVLIFLPHNNDADCAAGGKHRALPYNYVLEKMI